MENYEKAISLTAHVDKNLKIIVVDDTLTMRRIIRNFLTIFGFSDIEEAQDGKEAFNKIVSALENKRPFGLIISDWNMFGMSGFKLLMKLRIDERFEKIPFIMVTAEVEKGNISKAINAGANTYMAKPFHIDTLAEKIGQIFL
ncbi:MAG TPA: response regulator [Bacteriovoracaceae bacterium]|nr:response regulator [Bacteriovoracaceae bacterium]